MCVVENQSQASPVSYEPCCSPLEWYVYDVKLQILVAALNNRLRAHGFASSAGKALEGCVEQREPDLM